MTLSSGTGRGAGLPPTHLLYLHGFRSSPLSFKAQRLQAWLAVNRPEVQWWCPQLPPSPREAMALVLRGIEGWPADRSAVLGSSLGGFYATAVAQATGWPAVLLNPAVNPARDLATYIGELTAFHDPAQRFFFRPEHVDELRALAVPVITHPERLFAVIAKGDEVLDWREMNARYAGAQVHLLEGGDHALSDFDVHLPHILGFLGLGIDDLRRLAVVVLRADATRVVPTDPDDDHVIASALTGQADLIASADKRDLLPMGSFQGIPIIYAREAVERLEARINT